MKLVNFVAFCYALYDIYHGIIRYIVIVLELFLMLDKILLSFHYLISHYTNFIKFCLIVFPTGCSKISSLIAETLYISISIYLSLRVGTKNI